jgi:hypothetical protein
MPGLWRNQQGTIEGKYLVTWLRNGTGLGRPYFVVGARDPAAPAALEAYAAACQAVRCPPVYAPDLFRLQRRDGTEPAWPFFVFVAGDPEAPTALEAYAREAVGPGFDEAYRQDVEVLAGEYVAWAVHDPFAAPATCAAPRTVADVLALADGFRAYLAEHGGADPAAPRHRPDDPATVARMRAGRSA